MLFFDDVEDVSNKPNLVHYCQIVFCMTLVVGKFMSLHKHWNVV